MIHTFFSKQHVFNSASLLVNFFINWWSFKFYIDVLYNHYHYHVKMSMARPRSIYVVSMWSIFHFQPHFHCHYSSLPNRRDVTAINFLRIFYLQLCYFSHHVCWKWSKLPTTASLKIRERFRIWHKSVKIKLLQMHTENKSFECEIVTIYFENIYCHINGIEYRCAFN